MSTKADPERPSPWVVLVGWVLFMVAIWWKPAHGTASVSWGVGQTIFVTIVLPIWWYFYPRFSNRRQQ